MRTSSWKLTILRDETLRLIRASKNTHGLPVHIWRRLCTNQSELHIRATKLKGSIWGYCREAVLAKMVKRLKLGIALIVQSNVNTWENFIEN